MDKPYTLPGAPGTKLFSLGALVITSAASEALPRVDVTHAIRRHAAGLWGDLSDEDRLANENGTEARRTDSVRLQFHERHTVLGHHRNRPFCHDGSPHRRLLIAGTKSPAKRRGFFVFGCGSASRIRHSQRIEKGRPRPPPPSRHVRRRPLFIVPRGQGRSSPRFASRSKSFHRARTTP